YYASPEQLRGEAITVASDVYSLGTLLYELLTGTHPYESERKSLPALEHAVLQGDVAPASSQVRDKARAKSLHGDIDAILGKALQREPAKRYATADALAEDIERHLTGERVLAQPDSLGYRASKALRRHRLGFAVAGTILITVLAGAGMSVVQAKRANDAAERARVVKEFVVDVFKVNDRGNPANNELRQLPAELLLEHGAKLIATRFPGQPELQAELYGVVGRIFADMGSSKLAVEYATRQVESLTVFHASNEELARAMLLLAESLAGEDQLSDAALRARRALQFAAGDAALQIQARVALARILIAQAHYGDAGVELDRVAQSLQALARPLPQQIARSEADAQWQRARITADFNEQATLFEKAIEMALAAEDPASRLAAEIRLDFAYRLSDISRSSRIWSDKKRAAVAIQQVAAALSAMRSVGGPDDIGAALAQSWVTAMFSEAGTMGYHEAIEAVSGAKQIIARQGRRIPESIRARVDFDLGWIFANWGNVERAYGLQTGAVATLRPNAQSPFALQVLETSVGIDAMETGRHQEADQLLRRGLEWRKINSLSGGVGLSHGYIAVAWNLLMQGRYDEADQVLDTSPPSMELVSAKALIKLERGDAPGALQLLESIEPQAPMFEAFANEVQVTRGRALCGTGRPLEGIPLLEDVINRQAAKVYEHSPNLAHLRSLAGLCALATGRRDTAVALADLSRRAFLAQPGVSPYYKAPLQKLELALAGRR
ncbi:MAG: protein kinase, partial [Betaproteobacteria bacterium]